VSCLCTAIALSIIAEGALTSNEGAGIINEDRDCAVDIGIWWLFQEIANLFSSFEKKILVNQIRTPASDPKGESGWYKVNRRVETTTAI
jgi:hypothetical protein